MANPWTKKNPLLSLWLSSANTAAAPIRRAATAEASRQQARLAKQSLEIWRRAWLSPFAGKRRP